MSLALHMWNSETETEKEADGGKDGEREEREGEKERREREEGKGEREGRERLEQTPAIFNHLILCNDTIQDLHFGQVAMAIVFSIVLVHVRVCM